MSATKETWKPVPGWESVYEASSLGRIRRKSGNPFGTGGWRDGGRILKGTPLHGGHLKVNLKSKPRSEQWLVHRLVLFAFHGPPPKGTVGTHINGIPTDNRLCNLRWATQAVNLDDARKHGTLQQGERHYRAKLTADKVREIRNARESGEPYREIARRFGVSKATACRAAKRRAWAHV